MDKRTKLAALAMLAKAAAELAAGVATSASEAAAYEAESQKTTLPQVTGNLIMGALQPAEQLLDELTAIFRAMHALHQSRTV